MTFTTEWGCFQYIVMPFRLKNAPTIFSHIVIAAFKEFIHQFLEVYFDDWIVFGLLERHVVSVRMMVNTCQRYHIALNLKKLLFCAPFRTSLGHVVCRQGLMVYLAKVAVILKLDALRSVKHLHTTLGNTRYYRKFIKGYAQITMPMENLLEKDVTFYWNKDCKKSLDVLKEKMVTAVILVFLNWKEFHVHVDASCIELGVVLTQAANREIGPSYNVCKQEVIQG